MKDNTQFYFKVVDNDEYKKHKYMIETRNNVENPSRNLFYKTFINVKRGESRPDFEGLYKRIKQKRSSYIHNSAAKSKLKEKIFSSKLFEAKWDKSSKISIEDKRNSEISRSSSQPLFNFLYSKNYYDYRSDSDTMFTKSSLRELLKRNKIRQQELNKSDVKEQQS